MLPGDRQQGLPATDYRAACRFYNIRGTNYFEQGCDFGRSGVESRGRWSISRRWWGTPWDNVPGVPLVGPKFARQLLEQSGTLEAVLDHRGRRQHQPNLGGH